jgi:hypothetical protein
VRESNKTIGMLDKILEISDKSDISGEESFSLN